MHCAAQADGPVGGLQAHCWRRRRRTERVALHELRDRVESRGSDGAAGLWGLDDVQEGRQVCQGLHGRPVCGGARALASRRSQRAGSSRAAPVQVNTCRRSDLNSSSSGSTASSSCGEGQRQRCIARGTLAAPDQAIGPSSSRTAYLLDDSAHLEFDRIAVTTAVTSWHTSKAQGEVDAISGSLTSPPPRQHDVRERHQARRVGLGALVGWGRS